jgi:pimeloyl-ACP methyl ester carboxylesterase
MTVPTPLGGLHVTDQPGDEPAFVLMHGDDSRIYDRLVPLLAPRRAVAFDFLGHGRSDRPEASALDAVDHVQDLAAVVDSLGVEQITLVAHDASGPVAIDYAINEPGRVSHIVLLDTYYGHVPALRLPEMIRLLADEQLTPLADALMADFNQRLWLLQHTARQFGVDGDDPAGIGAVSVLPQFFGDGDTPDALPAIRAWTGRLFTDHDRQDEQIARGRLASLDVPVTLLFGALDEYLSPDLARHLALFSQAEVRVVEGASHWPEWDQPEAVARLVKELAT